MKITATCGHNVSEGISVSRGESGGSEYGTFCHHCVLSYYKSDLLLNDELISLIELVQTNARREFAKLRTKLS